MHPRTHLFLGLSLLLASCSTLQQNTDHQYKSLYLTGEAKHHLRLEKFVERFEAPSDKDIIEFFIDSIQASKTTFIRNGSQYPSDAAARWLKWKMYHRQFKDHPITTPSDFITRVASESIHSGQMYLVILEDGRRAPLGEILENELDAVRDAVEKKTLRSVLQKTMAGAKEAPQALSGTLPASAAPTAASVDFK